MISEVIREADELEHLLLSRGLRKVKDLQSLLWGERGACRGDEVTDVFDLWETKLCYLGVESDILSAKALEYSSSDPFSPIATRVHWYIPLAALKAVSTHDAGSRGV